MERGGGREISYLPTMKFIALAILATIALIKPQTVGDRYIAHVNTYNADSLDVLLDDSFILSRTFAKTTHTKTTFLNEYLPLCQSLHTRYDVLEHTSGNPEEILVQDHGDFFTLLQIPEPRWKLKVYTSPANRINKVVIDTTDGFAAYQQTANFMAGQFTKWLEETHPEENLNILVADKNNLYSKRLLEFRDRKE